MEPMPVELSVAIKEIKKICDDSRGSQYFEHGSYGYKNGIRHFLASSSEIAQLAVEPGNVDDLCKIMNVLSRRNVQFAVKGGGHGMAPTFSSTTGIQISMTRFSGVRYDADTQLVDVEAGCLWDQVYKALSNTKRNVVGGASADGVGVAGWLLGGGYSLKSNRHGLGIDNVVKIDIVTPDGKARTVSLEREKDLFQALRGGGNNFGIVTKFTLKTFAQSTAFGAYFTVDGARSEEFKEAMVKFVETEERPEACVIAAFRHAIERGKAVPEATISVFCVFDAEKPISTSSVPFQEFQDLAEGGAWKADPAKWQLGKADVSISDGTLLHIGRPQESRASVPILPIGRSVTLQHRSAVPGQDHPEFTVHAQVYRPDNADNILSSMDGGRSLDNRGSESGIAGSSGLFEEMSFDRFYGISSHPSMPESWTSEFEPDNYGAAGLDLSHASAGHAYTASETRLAAVGNARTAPKSKERPRMITSEIDKMGEVNNRGRFSCLMVSKYTKPLLDKMEEEAKNAASHLIPHGGISVVIDAWQVHSSIFADSPPGAAYPHEREKPFGPLLVYFRWADKKEDEFWLKNLRDTLNRIRVVVEKLQLTSSDAPLYSNLSLESVPPEHIYRGNMTWLGKVKSIYDPTDVMGRCGGHKIPILDDDSDN